MQQKTKKIIKLADKSRKNRILYDFLVLELVVETNLGTRHLDRDLLVPSYLNHQHAGKAQENEYYCKITRDDGCIFVPQGQAFPKQLLDQLDDLLRQAPPELKGCRSRKMITDYIRHHTDLTDCHFTALNQMGGFV